MTRSIVGTRARPRRRPVLVAAALAALTLAALPAAAGTLDQQQTSFGSAYGQIGIWDGDGVSLASQAQTFTSGLSGNLDEVDLPLRVVGNPGVPLVVEIQTTSAGVPTGTAIGSASVAQASVSACSCPKGDATTFGWLSIPLTSPAPVTAGGVYAVVLSAPGAAGTIDDFPLRSSYEWAGVSGDPYAGGTHIAQTGGKWDPDTIPVDLAFKTYVVPAYTATVQQPINPDGSSVFRTGRGVVPVKFTLSQNGVSTCALPPATIALTQLTGSAPGAVNESVYMMAADSGSGFRVDGCQYVYNLNVKPLAAGTYRADIVVGNQTVGNAAFELR